MPAADTVTREQLTAALERLGYAARCDPVSIPQHMSDAPWRGWMATIADEQYPGHTPEDALESALRELVPLDVLVRAVMEAKISV